MRVPLGFVDESIFLMTGRSRTLTVVVPISGTGFQVYVQSKSFIAPVHVKDPEVPTAGVTVSIRPPEFASVGVPSFHVVPFVETLIFTSPILPFCVQVMVRFVSPISHNSDPTGDVI